MRTQARRAWTDAIGEPVHPDDLDGFEFGREAFGDAVTTFDGQRYFLWLLLHAEQPTMDLEEVGELLSEHSADVAKAIEAIMGAES